MKKFKSLFHFFLIFLTVVTATGFWFHWAVQPRASQAEVKIFVIRQGEVTDSIVKRLYQEGFIRHPWAFKLLLYKEGIKGKIQAGDFRLSPSMSALEIGQTLTHGTLDYWVTLIEGWRSEEIAAELGLAASEFKKHEGFLFPDTYLIPKNASSAAVIKILKNNFNKKIAAIIPKLEKTGLTLRQVIILASIVEREAKLAEDRPIVAGILLKRWQNNWPLQADATVQYILGKEGNWWPKINKADLKAKSFYNTYLYSGLPPGPICNPGLATIKAVVDPQKTDYWFYLSDSQGKMHYAKTIEQHHQNIIQYL